MGKLEQKIKYGDIFMIGDRLYRLTKISGKGFNQYQLVDIQSGNIWSDNVYDGEITREEFIDIFLEKFPYSEMVFFCSRDEAIITVSCEQKIIRKIEWSKETGLIEKELKTL